MEHHKVTLNGITYRQPSRPVIVVCIDGSDPEYTEAGIAAGVLPNIERFMREGFHTVAQGSMPSFTCPNNMSIVTGSEPDVHGISGNYYLDRITGEPVVMTDPELLNSRSIMSEFSLRGVRVASITAKDKLRAQLQKDMRLENGSISLSAQFANSASLAVNGLDNALDYVNLPQPDMYSAELSLFVLDMGLKILEDRRPDILYLSLTDYIQHTHAPGSAEANRFYAEMDRIFGLMQEMDAVIALTADHGMQDKADDNGLPNVVWLQDILDEEFGFASSRVICPITDAFVGHHGSLGGFVRVYCSEQVDREDVIGAIKEIHGIEKVWSGENAARELRQPLDREGDIAVAGDRKTVIGGRAIEHDLSALKGQRLRTHGSLHEARVPMIFSDPFNGQYSEKAETNEWRSHQVFDYAINGID